MLVISCISGAIKPGSISQTAVNICNYGFILSFSAGAVVYYIACKIFLPKIYPDGEHERESKRWENMAPPEGFFLDDEIVPEYIRDRFVVSEGSLPSLVGQSSEGIEQKV